MVKGLEGNLTVSKEGRGGNLTVRKADPVPAHVRKPLTYNPLLNHGNRNSQMKEMGWHSFSKEESIFLTVRLLWLKSGFVGEWLSNLGRGQGPPS